MHLTLNLKKLKSIKTGVMDEKVRENGKGTKKAVVTKKMAGNRTKIAVMNVKMIEEIASLQSEIARMSGIGSAEKMNGIDIAP